VRSKHTSGKNEGRKDIDVTVEMKNDFIFGRQLLCKRFSEDFLGRKNSVHSYFLTQSLIRKKKNLMLKTGKDNLMIKKPNPGFPQCIVGLTYFFLNSKIH